MTLIRNAIWGGGGEGDRLFLMGERGLVEFDG